MKTYSKETDCVHGGTYIDSNIKGVNSPVFTSTAFEYMESGVMYPRYFNTPNQKAVTDKLCLLEKGEDGVVFSSGMAAVTTVFFALLKEGDHVILQNDLYGGTYHFAKTELNRFGIEYSFADEETSFEGLIKPNTKLVYIETPSNPLLKITDIAFIASLAKRKGLISLIDSTFGTPINQNPLELGIDIVIHSGTKYLSGHSDICCGAVISTGSLIQKIRESALHFGGSLNSATCYLLERSLKTLSIRVQKQNENALAAAKWLQKNSNISKVNYPGLESHPKYNIASKQMSGFGGMLSFELKDNIEPKQFLKKLKLIRPAVSLGGLETIISQPIETSHKHLTPEERRQTGITDKLLRLSTGIEDIQDILKDLDQALKN